MSDKPSPKSLPSVYLNSALSVLVGTIALCLSVQLLQSIVLPLTIVGVVFVALCAVFIVRRLRRPEQW